METGETTLDHADAQSPADGTPNGTSSAPGVDSSAYVAESPATPNATTPTAASSDAATPIAADASKADAHTDNEEEQEVQTEPVATEAAAETKAQSEGKIKGKNKRRSKRRSKSNEYAVESVLAVRRAADWAKDKPQYQVAVKWEGYADPTWHRLETLDNDRLVLELLFSEQVTEQPGMVKTRVCAAQPDDEEEGAKATGV